MPEELRELLASFKRLIADHDAASESAPDEGNDNFRCEQCVRCANCRFCTACEDCEDCTYCDACLECHGCTQSRECVGCSGISHSTHSGYCQGGAYLTLCYDCEDSVQCFACVGLTGAEFHILNRKYPRREYFKKVAEYRVELDALAVQGWFPPWIDGGDSELAEGVGGSPAQVGGSPAPPAVQHPPVVAPTPEPVRGTDESPEVASAFSSLLAALEGPLIETEPLASMDSRASMDPLGSDALIEGSESRTESPKLPSEPSTDGLDFTATSEGPAPTAPLERASVRPASAVRPPQAPSAPPVEPPREPEAEGTGARLLTRGVRPSRRR